MKTRIIQIPEGVAIQVAEVGAHSADLLDAFKACQEGRCSCPTQEYEKVESMRVEQSNGGISLAVKSRAGEQIDIAEIERCLAHTTKQLE